MPCDRKVTIGSGDTAIVLNDFSNRTKFFKLANAAEFLDAPPPNSTQTPKQGEHGVSESLSFYGARPFPFVIEIHAPTVEDRQIMERQLRALVSLPLIPDFSSNDGFLPLEVEEEDGTIMQTTAKIASNIGLEYYETGNNAYMRQRIRVVKFIMVSRQEFLTSPDLQQGTGPETFMGTNFEVVQGEAPTVPFDLYQEAVPSILIENNGWYGAYPVITVYGPTTGPYITNATMGGTVDLDGLVLSAGEYAVIDFYARTVVKNNGTDLSSYLTTATNWFYLAPGENNLQLRDDSPSALEATMLVQWRDTYI